MPDPNTIIDPDGLPTLSDYPNLESSHPIASVETYEDLTKGATLRTRNVPENQEQRLILAPARSPCATILQSSSRHASTGCWTTRRHRKCRRSLIVLIYRLNGLVKGSSELCSVLYSA